MATATQPRTTPGGDQLVELAGIDWKGYLTLLRLRGECSKPRIVYLDGNVSFKSPSYLHERLAERLGLFVVEVAVGLKIRFISSGHTTFRRAKKKGGAEGDKSFYFENAQKIRGQDRIQLRNDPPPDLVIEVVHSHGAEEAREVWRRFGVPEVWVRNAEKLFILALNGEGRYVEASSSIAFPFLTAIEIFEWVSRSRDDDELAWIIDLRDWVRTELFPRHHARPDRTKGPNESP